MAGGAVRAEGGSARRSGADGPRTGKGRMPGVDGWLWRVPVWRVAGSAESGKVHGMGDAAERLRKMRAMVGGLDRGIDRARSERLGEPVEPADRAEMPADEADETMIGRDERTEAEAERSADSPAPPSSSGPGWLGAGPVRASASGGRSPHGRAKPLRREPG